MRKISPSLLFVSASLLAAALAACSSSEPEILEPDLSKRLESDEVRAGIVAKDQDLIGGLKAEGRIGDIKMYNSHVAFIIEGVRRAGGYRYFGGNPVDADIIRAEGEEGRDLYGETFFAWDHQIFEPLELEIVSDGRESSAHVRLTGKTSSFAFADDLIRPLFPRPINELVIVYDYLLGPDDEELRLRITVRNPGDEQVSIQYPLMLASHGDGAHFFAPRAGFSAAGTGDIPYLAFVSRDLGYGLLSGGDDLVTLFEYDDVILFSTETFELHPGKHRAFTYYFTVTDQSAAGVQEARRRLIRDEPTGTIEGSVQLPMTASPSHTWIAVTDEDSIVTVAPVDDAGDFSVEVLPGDYHVHAYAHSHAAADPVTVAVSEGKTASTSLSLEAGARITSEVFTPEGEPVMSRVTFLRQEDTATPFAPSSVRHGEAWHRNISGAAYVLAEPETITLPAGKYEAIATRGPTWEMERKTIEVAAGEEKSLSFTIEQAVDTSGWLAADMHLHAYLSPDSHVPFEIRVKQAATDALDIPLLTEHIWAAGLQETVEKMGLEEEVIGIAGQEVTTFAYGHFNLFPVVVDPELPNNGGVYEHGRTPLELFEDMRAQHPGETIIQIDHPRGANPGSYFSYVGLDAEADTVEREEDWTLDWELIEVFNNSCGGSRNREVLADWIGMTNHGHRKGISGTTDSHTERRIPGIPRNWVLVDKDELREDHGKIVAPMRERRSFVSCGPFVRFEAEDGTGLGEMTQVDDEGLVRFRARVEAPTWMQVNEVILMENGEALETIDVSDRNGEVLRLDTILEAAPESDAWYALKAVGSGSLAPVSWRGPPYALTNPIEVDADRDGTWTPPARQ